MSKPGAIARLNAEADAVVNPDDDGWRRVVGRKHHTQTVWQFVVFHGHGKSRWVLIGRRSMGGNRCNQDIAKRAKNESHGLSSGDVYCNSAQQLSFADGFLSLRLATLVGSFGDGGTLCVTSGRLVARQRSAQRFGIACVSAALQLLGGAFRSCSDHTQA